MSAPKGYWLDDDRTALGYGALILDPASRRWLEAPDLAEQYATSDDIGPVEAVRWLQEESGHPVRPPIAVIGPRAARSAQADEAEKVGADLARMGLTILCGGKSGVMEAVCKGAAEHDGLTIGLLPDEDWEGANPYVRVPIASGIGVARNALIARAACCAIAIGGGYGTLSEVAFALQFERPVIGILDAPNVRHVHLFESWAQARDTFCRIILDVPV